MKRVLVVLLAIGMLAPSAAMATAPSSAIVLSFEKQGSVLDSHYVGVATGGVAVDMQLSGKTVLNGEVVSGWRSGARVHEEGQLVAFDATTMVATFLGTVQLLPGSA